MSHIEGKTCPILGHKCVKVECQGHGSERCIPRLKPAGLLLEFGMLARPELPGRELIKAFVIDDDGKDGIEEIARKLNVDYKVVQNFLLGWIKNKRSGDESEHFV